MKLPYEQIFHLPPPWIMGIVNVTPDSFSDGGSFVQKENAVSHAQAMRDVGASIIDIGGEATGPTSMPITAEEEIERIKDSVLHLAPEVFLSVDTYHSKTARFALENGARLINDVSALRADPEMAAVISEHKAFVVLMYSKEDSLTPHAKNTAREYDDVIKEIAEFLLRQIDYALSFGIALERIIIDPGMGRFVSHDPKYSWEILHRLEEFKTYGLNVPLLISTSRKGFLGGKIEERDPLSQLTGLSATLKGAQFIRTHNVKMAHTFFAAWQKIF